MRVCRSQGSGFCAAGGQCKKFPVIVGEFGSRLTDPRDLAVRMLQFPCTV